MNLICPGTEPRAMAACCSSLQEELIGASGATSLWVSRLFSIIHFSTSSPLMSASIVPFEEKDIIKNPAFRWEMEQKSGQPLSPCVEVNGTMLADISGEELERWMLQQGHVGQTERTTSVPLNAACSDAEHAAMAQGIPLKMHGDKVQS